MRSLIELPRVYAAAHQKGDQNDLLQIAGVVGTLGGALAPVAGRRRVYPRGWKGTLGADRFTALAHSPDVKHFKVKKPDYDFLAFEEVDRLLAAASPENVALLTTAPKPGLRQEERIGLRWQDVDLTRARLHVKRPPWRGVEGTPKGRSTRAVDLPQSVVDTPSRATDTSAAPSSSARRTECTPLRG
ncbi:tyrosine-type recombinase/integrase [Corallococcus sp. Z5C101001]|uniref:tyrosine-type recombinase/integrase n=1 Tax=Corallococcus sp. Z5C101001 TaxID=2596829 RepID=UPI002102FE07|nr:tyrosine-type recombinase/integrase [Corallococcus sp. Z5C101001]